MPSAAKAATPAAAAKRHETALAGAARRGSPGFAAQGAFLRGRVLKSYILDRRFDQLGPVRRLDLDLFVGFIHERLVSEGALGRDRLDLLGGGDIGVPRGMPDGAAFGAAHLAALGAKIGLFDLVGALAVGTNDKHACRESPLAVKPCGAFAPRHPTLGTHG